MAPHKILIVDQDILLLNITTSEADGTQIARPTNGAPAAAPSTITYETMTVDKASKRCLIDGHEVKLRKKEFEILVLLLEHRERIFTREEILSKIWSNEVIVLHRVVDVNITRLRQAIGKYGKHIITRSGYGYGFTELVSTDA